MKSKRDVLFAVGVFIMGWAPVATAQQAESQLRLVEDIHISPGMADEFETLSKGRTARMAKGMVAFGRRASVSESGVYKYVTLLESDFASLDTRREQIDAMPPADTPGGARGIIEYIDGSIGQTRPELSYVPDNPRLEPSEFGFIRAISLYLKFGAEGEVAELLQQISELNSTRNSRDFRFVSSQVAGPGGQVLFLAFPARDAADYYTQQARSSFSGCF